jgi:hydrogenase nickel incorporation protein HypA/HybF
VKVAVGDLSAVEPELLAYTWQAVTADGPDAGARLEIDWRPARQFCPQCLTDKPRPESSWLPICPDCGSPLTVEGGSELTLLEVSFLAEEEAKA